MTSNARITGSPAVSRPLGRSTLVAAALFFGFSCSEDTGVVPPSVDGTARITGLVYLDENGSGIFESELDDLVAGALVSLRFAASGVVITDATTDSQGEFDFAAVPVATLRLAVDEAFLADSLVARFEQPDTFSVAPGDSLGFLVGVGAPERTISEIRTLPPGEQVFASGIALNDWADLDGALHLENGGAYLRVTDVPSVGIGPGDSVRVSGRTALLESEIILVDGQAFTVDQDARPVTALAVTTNDAQEAGGGGLDAALVEMSQVQVMDTATVADGFVMVGNDGSGDVSIRIRESTGVELAEVSLGQVFPVVRGLLVPAAPGVWEVVPRSRDDADPPSS
ncbi:MAG: carboxypeptidase regulatory-like domain-containing protein [Gemmatimonadetes bacterium]|nr:carboxypeptidase regulatory-like domain-containing protein [Gemmatimonadota bacterium]